MREILFRGKRIDNGEWVEGNIFIPDNVEKCEPPTEILIGTNVVRISYEVIPETVGQYTGLTDKNGRRIFEGDIIDASDNWWYTSGPGGCDSPIILVECYNNFCGFEPFINYDCDYGVYIFAENCEVLGNIHDNPELLKMRNDQRRNR